MRRRLIATVAVVAIAAAGCGGDDDNATTDPTGAALWVGRSSQELVLVDGRGDVQATVDLCCVPRALAPTDDDVWVSTDTDTVLRVDKASSTVTAEIDVGGSAGALAAGEGSVWVAVDTAELVQISMASNEITSRQTLGSDAAPLVGLALDQESVWALLDFALAVVRVDASTGKPAGRLALCPETECRVGATATAPGLAAGTLWILDDTTDELLAVDTATVDVRARRELRASRWNLTAGAGGVFLIDADEGVALRVDTDDPSDLDRSSVRFQRPTTFAVGDDSLWLYDEVSKQIVGIDTDELDEVGRFAFEDVRVIAVG